VSAPGSRGVESHKVGISVKWRRMRPIELDSFLVGQRPHINIIIIWHSISTRENIPFDESKSKWRTFSVCVEQEV